MYYVISDRRQCTLQSLDTIDMYWMTLHDRALPVADQRRFRSCQHTEKGPTVYRGFSEGQVISSSSSRAAKSRNLMHAGDVTR